jgi:hypothetical protein
MNERQLKELFADLPDLDPETTWDSHRLSLRTHVANHSLSKFLRWSTITATMFVGEAPYIEHELLSLMNDRDYWESALSESDVGRPVGAI